MTHRVELIIIQGAARRCRGDLEMFYLLTCSIHSLVVWFTLLRRHQCRSLTEEYWRATKLKTDVLLTFILFIYLFI